MGNVERKQKPHKRNVVVGPFEIQLQSVFMHNAKFCPPNALPFMVGWCCLYEWAFQGLVVWMDFNFKFWLFKKNLTVFVNVTILPFCSTGVYLVVGGRGKENEMHRGFHLVPAVLGLLWGWHKNKCSRAVRVPWTQCRSAFSPCQSSWNQVGSGATNRLLPHRIWLIESTCLIKQFSHGLGSWLSMHRVKV